MEQNVIIEKLEAKHIKPLIEALANSGINRADGYFDKCLLENEAGDRYSLIALCNEQIMGYVHVIYSSEYQFFCENRIPEINDLIVLPQYWRQGIGRKLILCAEEIVAREYDKIGLGVGLYKDYGSAQRLYFSLGYKPDGRGMFYKGESVMPGNYVFVDDDLLMYLYKELR